MKEIKIPVKLDEGVVAPSYAHPTDSGMDLRANEDVWLQPMERRKIKTGVRMAIPEGYEGQVRPRSSVAANQGVTVLNSPGTIDAHYRGDITIPLVNLSKKPVAIRKGDRVAQLVIQEVPRADLVIVDELDETDRGEGGFGSTGLA